MKIVHMMGQHETKNFFELVCKPGIADSSRFGFETSGNGSGTLLCFMSTKRIWTPRHGADSRFCRVASGAS